MIDINEKIDKIEECLKFIMQQKLQIIISYMQFKTFSLSVQDIEKKWFIVDATNLTVGRLAVFVTNLLRGKHKNYYAPHMDCGDNVIIINANLVKFTGKKFQNKIYYRHTGFPGGLKEATPKDMMIRNRYDRVIEMSIRRMMGLNGPLSRKRMKNLYIYGDSNHKHQAQKPEAIDFAAFSRKNYCCS